ncbi:MAG: hypothetical protein WAO76_02700 [Georgfuchsia sp.]
MQQHQWGSRLLTPAPDMQAAFADDQKLGTGLFHCSILSVAQFAEILLMIALRPQVTQLYKFSKWSNEISRMLSAVATLIRTELRALPSLLFSSICQ